MVLRELQGGSAIWWYNFRHLLRFILSSIKIFFQIKNFQRTLELRLERQNPLFKKQDK